MPDMMATGLAWLAEQQANHAAVVCTLKPPQSAAITVRVTLGKARVQVPDAGGAELIVETPAAIVPSTDLNGYQPRNGDRLTGAGVDYVVAAPGHGVSSWAWTDVYKTRMRVYLREHNGTGATS